MLNNIWVRIRAQFAAFRWLQAGEYRATSPTITPSAAWGLILNLSGIETRKFSNKNNITLREDAIPKFEIAIGDIKSAQISSLYQQLHTYPVNASNEVCKDLKLNYHSNGTKYWIVPTYREVLNNIDIILGVRNIDKSIIKLINNNLINDESSYGLPFLGDNNFIIDQINILNEPITAYWYDKVDDNNIKNIKQTHRLTVDINREDSSKTINYIYKKSKYPSEPSESAWTLVPN